MHLPINTALIKILHVAFPNDTIYFGASAQYIQSFRQCFSGYDRVVLGPITPLPILRTSKSHVPWHGRAAARRCWSEVERLSHIHSFKLCVLGGMDANLLDVFQRKWRQHFAKIPLHYVLHHHLSAAKTWRSRNPLYRPFDFLSVFSKSLPHNQSIVVLELGLGETIEDEFPRLRNRVITLEHPILESECADPRMPAHGRPLRIGFVGHCSCDKGFDVFIALADTFSGAEFEFHAIGQRHPNIYDSRLSSLARRPAECSIPRAKFLDAVRAMDLVCLPFPPERKYVASGSIVDSFAAAKPLVITSNRMVRAIQHKYGDFGEIMQGQDRMWEFFEKFDRNAFLKKYEQWTRNIQRIQVARRSVALAQTYRSSSGLGRADAEFLGETRQ